MSASTPTPALNDCTTASAPAISGASVAEQTTPAATTGADTGPVVAPLIAPAPTPMRRPRSVVVLTTPTPPAPAVTVRRPMVAVTDRPVASSPRRCTNLLCPYYMVLGN